MDMIMKFSSQTQIDTISYKETCWNCNIPACNNY